MKLETMNSARAFPVADTEAETGITELKVVRLTLKQMKAAYTAFEDRARELARNEFVAVSKTMPRDMQHPFLVMASKANTVADPAAVEAVTDSGFGIVTVLAMATTVPVPELERMLAQDMATLDMARYHAMGVDVDALTKAMADAETKTGGTFPQ